MTFQWFLEFAFGSIEAVIVTLILLSAAGVGIRFIILNLTGQYKPPWDRPIRRCPKCNPTLDEMEDDR